MIIFKPWRQLRVQIEEPVVRRFLLTVAAESKTAFEAGIEKPKRGWFYQGNRVRSSAPGEYPARQTGALKKSMRTRVTRREATIGTNVYYSRFLREGTRRMARRRMSDDALKTGMVRTQSGLRGWIAWKRSRK